jgi:hypothetical protein
MFRTKSNKSIVISKEEALNLINDLSNMLLFVINNGGARMKSYPITDERKNPDGCDFPSSINIILEDK